MLLGRQLLRAKFVRSGDFQGERCTLSKTKGIKGNSCNQSVVRDQHCHRPEESFQVVWKFCAACISRIHRDEAVAGELEGNFCIFKVESFLFQFNSLLDGLYLLSNDGKYLELDSVELVKATPSSAACQSFEHFAHTFEVQPI